MNTRHLVSACAMAMLIVVWGIAPAVLDAQTPDADEFPDAESVEPYHTSPAGSLGSSNVNVIDGWFIDCPSGTHHVHFNISDHSSGGPTLGIVAV